jgi:phosphoribosylaminoimidazolecarboxamide formyltransferase/IMP cyclohydrolase
MIKRALISVSDKSGILEFAKALTELNIELLSTGGTYSLLKENAIPVKKVAEITQFPEILDGRVKTLHPAIHGGILAKRNKEHLEQLAEHKFGLIDLVIVNLYPFETTIKKPNVSYEEAIENIDIGGPTMLRSAAKNHHDVTVLVDSADYQTVLEEIKESGDTSLKTRKKLALKTFQHTAHYDSQISNYLNSILNTEMPDKALLSFSKKQDLRYGENPHQKAAFYEDINDSSLNICSTKQIWGKELSYNNILDLDAALNITRDFINDHSPFAVIIKHTNPCGAALGNTALGAYQRAVACDPVSYFGGIVGVNTKVDASLAEELGKSFLECIIAPDFDDDALEILKSKKNIRLMIFDKNLPLKKSAYNVRRVSGGLLMQEFDDIDFDINIAQNVTIKLVSDEEKITMAFAWKMVKHVKSNAIILASKGQLVGIGAGQMSRVDSAEIALKKARQNNFEMENLILASDAFFPFRDSIDMAAANGITGIIQPGGSIKDKEVIAAANEHNISMLFTAIRHFNH